MEGEGGKRIWGRDGGGEDIGKGGKRIWGREGRRGVTGCGYNRTARSIGANYITWLHRKKKYFPCTIETKTPK